MSQMKRSLLSIDQSINHETKKFRELIEEKKSITCIENFSNELFYEIFDYLDGCDIVNAFSNLNIRFHNFLNNSSFLLKIYRFSTDERTFERYCKQVIIPNKHKIISLNLYDQILINLSCTLCNIDLSFNRLESLVLYGIKLNQLLPLLVNLTVLSRLFSLNIRLIGSYKVLRPVYKLIFNLPSLKYMKFSPVMDRRIGLLAIAIPEQITTIEHLNINHGCPLCKLNVILSYTPQLRYLTCQRLFKSSRVFSHTLSLLTHISINECYLNFNEFEIFIKQICSKLEVLRLIDRSNDIAYLDADRWKRLILEYIPNLRTFYFQFFENLSSFHSFTSYHTRINQFTTSFWTDRRWIFELKMDFLHDLKIKMTYSLHSNRKEWFNCPQIEQVINPSQQENFNFSNQFHQFIQLTVTSHYFDKAKSLFINTIDPIFSWIRITRLDVDCSMIPIVTVIELIRRLPNIDSLRIFPMAVKQIHCLSENDIENLILDSRNNKLTKMKLRLITEIEQVVFFIRLIQYIEYLEIECSNDIDLIVLVQQILIKTTNCITSQLCSLCLCIGQINDEIIEKLHKIMALEDFLHDYTIKHVYDRIYLQWK